MRWSDKSSVLINFPTMFLQRAAAKVLHLFHVFLVCWVGIGWAVVNGATLLSLHALTCVSIVTTWFILDSCPLTILTNRLEGKEVTRTFFPAFMERASVVYAATSICFFASTLRIFALVAKQHGSVQQI